jgi:hypothetical protein
MNDNQLVKALVDRLNGQQKMSYMDESQGGALTGSRKPQRAPMDEQFRDHDERMPHSDPVEELEHEPEVDEYEHADEDQLKEYKNFPSLDLTPQQRADSFAERLFGNTHNKTSDNAMTQRVESEIKRKANRREDEQRRRGKGDAEGAVPPGSKSDQRQIKPNSG